MLSALGDEGDFGNVGGVGVDVGEGRNDLLFFGCVMKMMIGDEEI